VPAPSAWRRPGQGRAGRSLPAPTPRAWAAASPAYKKPSTDLSYDKDAATKLLSDAGVSGLEVNLVSTDHPWVLSLVPQIKSDLEALGLKVNHTQMASSDLYANVTDVDNPTYDIVLAPGDP